MKPLGFFLSSTNPATTSLLERLQEIWGGSHLSGMTLSEKVILAESQIIGIRMSGGFKTVSEQLEEWDALLTEQLTDQERIDFLLFLLAQIKQQLNR